MCVVRHADCLAIKLGEPYGTLILTLSAESKQRILEALGDKPGVARDIVALNAGAALYVSGVAATVAVGIERARAVMANGAARLKLDEFVAATRKHAA